uniref:Uncharacterized protein n=1 Tax=Zea mays TaxID=4577 RepID=A0A804LC68_MAIZE
MSVPALAQVPVGSWFGLHQLSAQNLDRYRRWRGTGKKMVPSAARGVLESSSGTHSGGFMMKRCGHPSSTRSWRDPSACTSPLTPINDYHSALSLLLCYVVGVLGAAAACKPPWNLQAGQETNKKITYQCR